jgi:hypothetical protein
LPRLAAGYGTGMASSTITPSRRPQQQHRHEHHLVEDVVGAVSNELHHLLEIEEKGDSPLTALIVFGQVVLALLVIVAVETAVAMSFYFGWL